MQALIERIQRDAVHIGGGIVKVDSFLNHQVDASLMAAIGAEFVRRFTALGVTGISKIITAEVSGILPALSTAQVLGVPLVYARKQMSKTMTDQYFEATAESRTRGTQVLLRVSQRFLGPADRVLLIDDFLATGSTIDALLGIVGHSGATLCGIGCVIEKPAEGGRERLAGFQTPIETLAKIEWRDNEINVYG